MKEAMWTAEYALYLVAPAIAGDLSVRYGNATSKIITAGPHALTGFMVDKTGLQAVSSITLKMLSARLLNAYFLLIFSGSGNLL